MKHIECPNCHSQIKLKNLGPESSHSEKSEKELINIDQLLDSFSVNGNFLKITRGPALDLFLFDCADQESISQLLKMENDLSHSFEGAPVRIIKSEEIIYGARIEIPRLDREIINLNDILDSSAFNQIKYNLPIVAKDVLGQDVFLDLESLRHLLIAGSTGSGKSSFIHTILASLLKKNSPDQLKLMLIDPKKLEFDLYSKSPHLLMPVISEFKVAKNALLWVSEEVLRRSTSLSEQVGLDLERQDLPRIVIMIDELADLMLTREGRGFESLISDLLANGAQVGIHLIISTQRPSIDVITKKISSDDLTRISFKLNYLNDSKTILNAMGGEKLLGKGDMLVRCGTNISRFHSAFIWK